MLELKMNQTAVSYKLIDELNFLGKKDPRCKEIISF